MDASLQSGSRPRELGPGARIGKYTVIRRLARGGMAEVLLAREEAFVGVERLVAVKLILPHMADEARFLSMFKAEARVAATLDHPSIAQVLDAGEVDGEPFLAMEYVHGRTVQALLRAAADRDIRIPLGSALALVIGACSGLHYAHERRDLSGRALQIVHRDVSPSNLMLRYDGSIKLLDFGIAKAATQTSATQTGIFKGKSGYMSPEQCADEPLDRRSDVFNLGIMLYELTTARRAFFGDNPVAVINKIANGRFASPREVSPDYPPELERIVLRAMAVSPEDRHPTAEELQLELEAFVRARKLDVSSTALAALMRAVFGEEPYPSVPAFTRTEVAPLPAIVDVDDASLAETVARARGRSRGWIPLAIVGVLALSGAGVAMWPGDPASDREGDDGSASRSASDPAQAGAPQPDPEPRAAAGERGVAEPAGEASPPIAPATDAEPSEPPKDTQNPPLDAAAPTDAPASPKVEPRTRPRRAPKAKKTTDTRRTGPKGMYP